LKSVVEQRPSRDEERRWFRARLGRMHDIMAAYVERGDVPGSSRW